MAVQECTERCAPKGNHENPEQLGMNRLWWIANALAGERGNRRDQDSSECTAYAVEEGVAAVEAAAVNDERQEPEARHKQRKRCGGDGAHNATKQNGTNAMRRANARRERADVKADEDGCERRQNCDG